MTTSTPTGYLLPRRETFVALSGVLLAMLVAAINQTVLTTAMPRMIEDLGGLEYYSWVFSGYVLALAVTAPIYGNLSDIHGARPLMLAGLTIFLVGSVVGATADTMLQVVIARIVLGIGAGGLIPLAYRSIADLVPASERGRWQGISGAAFGAASLIGPGSGGWIADNANWRWVFVASGASLGPPAAVADALQPVFLLGVPLMLGTLALVWLVPETRLRRGVRDDVDHADDRVL